MMRLWTGGINLMQGEKGHEFLVSFDLVRDVALHLAQAGCQLLLRASRPCLLHGDTRGSILLHISADYTTKGKKMKKKKVKQNARCCL